MLHRKRCSPSTFSIAQIVISDSAATAKDASSRGQAPATRSGKNRSNTQQTTNSVLHVFGRSPHQRGRKLIKASMGFVTNTHIRDSSPAAFGVQGSVNTAEAIALFLCRLPTPRHSLGTQAIEYGFYALGYSIFKQTGGHRPRFGEK